MPTPRLHQPGALPFPKPRKTKGLPRPPRPSRTALPHAAGSGLSLHCFMQILNSGRRLGESLTCGKNSMNVITRLLFPQLLPLTAAFMLQKVLSLPCPPSRWEKTQIQARIRKTVSLGKHCCVTQNCDERGGVQCHQFSGNASQATQLEGP